MKFELHTIESASEAVKLELAAMQKPMAAQPTNSLSI